MSSSTHNLLSSLSNNSYNSFYLTAAITPLIIYLTAKAVRNSHIQLNHPRSDNSSSTAFHVTNVDPNASLDAIPTILLNFLLSSSESSVPLELPINVTVDAIINNILLHHSDNRANRLIYSGRILDNSSTLAQINGLEAGAVIHVQQRNNNQQNTSTINNTSNSNNHNISNASLTQQRQLRNHPIRYAAINNRLSLLGLLLLFLFSVYTLIIGGLWGLYYALGEKLFNPIYFYVLTHLTIINCLCIYQLFLKDIPPAILTHAPLNNSNLIYNRNRNSSNHPNRAFLSTFLPLLLLIILSCFLLL
jgi:hypothetical protein